MVVTDIFANHRLSRLIPNETHRLPPQSHLLSSKNNKTRFFETGLRVAGLTNIAIELAAVGYLLAPTDRCASSVLSLSPD